MLQGALNKYMYSRNAKGPKTFLGSLHTMQARGYRLQRLVAKQGEFQLQSHHYSLDKRSIPDPNVLLNVHAPHDAVD